MIQDLIDRVYALPRDMHERALIHINDALKDLRRWPEYSDKILADCEESIKYYEELSMNP